LAGLRRGGMKMDVSREALPMALGAWDCSKERLKQAVERGSGRRGRPMVARCRWFSPVVVIGGVGVWLAVLGALALGANPDEQSQKDADIHWFLEKATQAAAGIGEASDKAATYCTIAAVQTEVGDVAASKEVIELARQAAAGITGAYQKALALCSVAELQAQVGDAPAAKQSIELAQGAAAGIRGSRMRAWVYCSMAEAQAKAGDAAAAEQAIQIAQGAAETAPDPVLKVAAYCRTAEAQVRVGNRTAYWTTMPRAKAAAGRILDHELMYNAFADMVATEARVGQFSSAYALAGGIAEPVPNAAAHCSIAEAQAKAGNRAESARVFEWANYMAARIGDAGQRAKAFEDIAQAQARVGEFVSPMGGPPASEDAAYQSVLAGCAAAEALGRARKNAEAQEVMKSCEQDAAGIRGALEKAIAHYLIAEAEAKLGNTAASQKSFELAKQAAATVAEEGWRAQVCAGIVGAQVRTGDFAGAVRSAAGIGEAWWRNWAYATIAQAQVRAGEVAGVKAWVETLTVPQEVVEACLGAVKGLRGQDEGK
jgi:hypothetical protein